jgi:hypothetical protein
MWYMEPSTLEQRIADAMHALGDLTEDGAEENDFMLTARIDDDGAPRTHLECRSCGWGLAVGQMELWEFIAEAREHYETKHLLAGA